MRLAIPILLLTLATAAKPAGPRSWTLTTFREAGTGVTFRYPAAMQPTTDVGGYFSPALTQMEGIQFHAQLAYIPKTPDPQPDEAWTDLDKLVFLYATEPVRSAESCENLTKNLGDEDLPTTTQTLMIHGIEFAVGDSSGAGLSHFINGKVYATFRSNTCFLFEYDIIGLDHYAGDVTNEQWKEFENHLAGIMQTVRIAP